MQGPELIFLEALENLLAEEFDRFKYALTCIECDGGGKIPKCRLEEANTQMKLVDFICSYYGEDVAVKMAIFALELMKMRDAAANLRVKRAKDYRLKYSEHIQNQYKVIKDMNSHLGENVNLNSRYTKLIIVKEHPSSVTINCLFDPDKDGQIPPIVVLQGAAGIGKTMTAKKIMFDWAVGELYQSRFDYVFYINCREINSGIEQGSVADLTLKNCPDQNAPVDKILRNPEKLLFIIDGFDELRFSFAQSESNLCSDPFEKQSAAMILSSLFRKKVLSKSYLIVTTRPTALEELQQYLQGEWYAEILGFTEAEREEYFYKFFKNEEKTRKAFNFVKENEMLFTMCFVPIVCWIICTVLNQQMEEGKDLAQDSERITGMYMLYVFSLLKGHSSNSKQQIQVNWKGLCSLAKHGLDMSDSLFLNENVFLKYNDTECVYSFIHLSLQEFFAALFYVLEKEDTMVEESETAVNDVKKLLENYGKSRNYLTLTVRFLFGLLNTETMEAINKKIKCKISSKIKPDLLKWIKNKLKISSLSWKSDEELSPLKSAEMIYLLEEFHCLYEIQEQSFVQSALNHFTELNLAEYNFSKMDQVALSFCLKNCCKLETLNLNLCLFGSEDPNKDFPRELHQDESNHSDIYLFCRALKEPNCKLKKLKLWGCVLTAACCGDLSSVLRTSQNLTVLELGYNKLRDLGMQLLCEGLEHPNCKLQKIK
uniref:Uncharacterized protein n=1 Tax=Gopherus evgoodei TaxID=1825980 RepID=A0A8C4Y916_9SAUR